jgi:hypothetical protein
MRAQIWLAGSSIYFEQVIFNLLSLAGKSFQLYVFQSTGSTVKCSIFVIIDFRELQIWH